jgi:hypothetical protein
MRNPHNSDSHHIQAASRDQIRQILSQALLEVVELNRDVFEIADRLAAFTPRQRERFAEHLQDVLGEWVEDA